MFVNHMRTASVLHIRLYVKNDKNCVSQFKTYLFRIAFSDFKVCCVLYSFVFC